MKLRYYLLTAAFAAVPVAAFAHGDSGHHRGGHDRPGRAELDKDGNLTLEAAKAASAERFKRIDANADGQITPDEAPAMFERPDANADGKVTADELAMLAEARLKRADANGDGVVSKDERKAMRAKHKEGRKGHHDRDGDDDDKAAPAAPPPN